MTTSQLPASSLSQTATNPIDNELIVNLIAAGHAQGEQLLYQSYSRGLRFLAARYCPEHAEDCMHDAILAAIEQIKAGKLQIPGALPGYLAIILKRAAWSKNAELKRRVGNEDTFDLVVSTKAEDRPDPERSLEIQERTRLMRKGLERLKPAQREILTRFYVQGQKPEQICREMNLTATQFRLMKSRSKQVLEKSVTQTIRTTSLRARAAAMVS
jgi:RNA polymerase sigma-70 factor, ECF subfamily